MKSFAMATLALFSLGCASVTKGPDVFDMHAWGDSSVSICHRTYTTLPPVQVPIEDLKITDPVNSYTILTEDCTNLHGGAISSNMTSIFTGLGGAALGYFLAP